MSQEFWQPLKNNLHFKLCDICGDQKELNWLQLKSEGKATYVRFLCEACYSKLSISDEASSNITDHAVGESQEIDENSPQWVKDFIQKQRETGKLQEIGDVSSDEQNQAKPELIYEKLQESTSQLTKDFIKEQREAGQLQEIGEVPDLVYSESNTEEIEIDVEEAEDKTNFTQVEVAPWSTGFIKEALFSADPLAWLEKQRAFDPINQLLSVKTLIPLTKSQAKKVKIASVKALVEILNNSEKSLSQKIKSELQDIYDEESDEAIKEFISPLIK